ncbi:hypothetical protein KI387_006077, partial [Taxus chinensis]
WDIWAKKTRRTRNGEVTTKRDKEAHFRWFGRICPRQSGTVGPEVHGGRGEPKEPRANQITPRVFASKRDKEARVGWIK